MAFVAERMEKQVQLTIRRARDRKRKEQIRKDQLMINYIKVKYPLKYEEASDYYNTLNKMHPTTHDLRKTYRFKEFKGNTKSHDNLVLKIPLMNPESNGDKETINHEPKDTTNHEAQEMINREDKETINDIFPDIDPATLVPELPPQFIDQIINELRADPDLAALMDDAEEYANEDLFEKEQFW